MFTRFECLIIMLLFDTVKFRKYAGRELIIGRKFPFQIGWAAYNWREVCVSEMAIPAIEAVAFSRRLLKHTIPGMGKKSLYLTI